MFGNVEKLDIRKPWLTTFHVWFMCQNHQQALYLLLSTIHPRQYKVAQWIFHHPNLFNGLGVPFKVKTLCIFLALATYNLVFISSGVSFHLSSHILLKKGIGNKTIAILFFLHYNSFISSVFIFKRWILSCRVGYCE